jgi:hypothetical protein
MVTKVTGPMPRIESGKKLKLKETRSKPNLNKNDLERSSCDVRHKI